MKDFNVQAEQRELSLVEICAISGGTEEDKKDELLQAANDIDNDTSNRNNGSRPGTGTTGGGPRCTSCHPAPQNDGIHGRNGVGTTTVKQVSSFGTGGFSTEIQTETILAVINPNPSANGTFKLPELLTYR